MANNPKPKQESLRERMARNHSPFAGVRKQTRRRKPLWIERKIRTWGERILGAMGEGGMGAAEEEFDSNQTSQDFIWNTIGLAAWGMVFPILTVVITQLVGAEEAGRFALAFVAGHLLMFVANYGVRTYQVSDRDESHQFIDYQVNRWITCVIMIVAGWLFCQFRGYDANMATMSMAVFIYKMIDGMADVYEGRLQQMDKLYLAGISQCIRSLSVLLFFSAFLLFTRSITAASITMAVVAVLSLVFITLPLALLETPKSGAFRAESLARLFVHCAPVFLALFLYQCIDNMPKFMMEGVLSYDNQLYFNALYFPAQTILMTVGFMYKPLLGRMADAWNDSSRRSRFDIFIVAALLVIAVLTLVAVLLMRWVGIPLMSFMYGIDFEPFRRLAYFMLLAGGITGGIDFLYQVVTVMRRQAVVTKLYLITFVFALVVPYMLIRVSGLEGAVMSYVIVMAILFVLLLLEYVGVRLGFTQGANGRVSSAAPGRSRRTATSKPRSRPRPRPSVRDDLKMQDDGAMRGEGAPNQTDRLRPRSRGEGMGNQVDGSTIRSRGE